MNTNSNNSQNKTKKAVKVTIILTHYIRIDIACELLNMDEEKILELAQRKEINFKIVKSEIFFIKGELIDWMFRQNPRYIASTNNQFNFSMN